MGYFIGVNNEKEITSFFDTTEEDTYASLVRLQALWGEDVRAIPVTNYEYSLLKAVNGDINWAKRILQALETMIKG